VLSRSCSKNHFGLRTSVFATVRPALPAPTMGLKRSLNRHDARQPSRILSPAELLRTGIVAIALGPEHCSCLRKWGQRVVPAPPRWISGLIS
jgi:hypothetical protein